MQSPRIVFATSCKGRVEHLKQTLPQNLIDNASYPNAKFVIMDYSDPGGLLDYLQDVTDPRVAVYHYRSPNGDVPFHVSHAKNMAMRCALLEGADILVTVDADNYTGPGFAQFIADQFEGVVTHPGMFLCPNFPYIRTLPYGPGRPDRGYAGRLAIRAHDFVKMGGYDESFDTWHGEDVDMSARLRRLGYEMRYFETGHLRTIPHGADVRFKEYPHAKQYENPEEWKSIDDRTTTVVNNGKFGCGTVYKNFDFKKPIELHPVPTRIFGIGMQKTGTTTLHHALQILGYDSFHWGAGEAPIIWQEMQRDGRSAVLERRYALSDNPIPLLYEQLDKAYPGSKFILTTRNEEDWLRSVEGLWDYTSNPTRWVWDAYPFTNHIHTVLYGQKEFNREVFLERYRRHNVEVRQYFKGRPDDLLIMNIDRKPGWAVLCDFLDVDQPSVPYPYSNTTAVNREYRAMIESGVGYCDLETPLLANDERAIGIAAAQEVAEEKIARLQRQGHPLTDAPCVLDESQYKDKTIADCVKKFDNKIVFSGEPFIPEPDPKTTQAVNVAELYWAVQVKSTMIDEAKSLAAIPIWRDLNWWGSKCYPAVDFVRRHYRIIIVFVVAILVGLLFGAGMARLLK